MSYLQDCNTVRYPLARGSIDLCVLVPSASSIDVVAHGSELTLGKAQHECERRMSST